MAYNFLALKTVISVLKFANFLFSAAICESNYTFSVHVLILNKSWAMLLSNANW